MKPRDLAGPRAGKAVRLPQNGTAMHRITRGPVVPTPRGCRGRTSAE